MKKSWIFILLIILIIIIIFLYKLNISKQESKMQNNVSINNTAVSNESNNTTTITPPTPPQEIPIGAFSTDLVSRYTNSKENISVGLVALDGTIVENGEIFSFWDTLGDTTPEKGYVEADSFDDDGDTIQTYGGGVCQISSTLYNVVLQAPEELTVIERHPHSKPVVYVEEGKDATVSYPSVDFRFQNNSGYPIKIQTEYADTSITISIVKIV